MAISTALNSFEQNCKAVNQQIDPVTWRLNNGLYQLALAVQDIQARVKHYERLLRDMENQLNRIEQ